MKYRFPVTLSSCGSCVSHSHCKDCGHRVEEDLRETPFIKEAAFDAVHKVLTVDTLADPEALEEYLEDKGIFLLGSTLLRSQ